MGNGGGGDLDGVPASVEDGGVVGDEDVDAVDVGGRATRSGRRRGPGGGGAPRRRGRRGGVEAAGQRRRERRGEGDRGRGRGRERG